MDQPSNLLTTLAARFAGTVLGTQVYRGQAEAVVRREGLREVARFLRDDPVTAFDFLMDLTAVDYHGFGRTQTSAPRLRTPSPLPYFMTPKRTDETWQRLADHDAFRFDVVYHFYSTRHAHRLRLRVPVDLADPVVDSLTGLWASANWFEREVWDMFGIRFTGHPNLKRILLYESFQGHPLRKDYPHNKRQPLIGPLN